MKIFIYAQAIKVTNVPYIDKLLERLDQNPFKVSFYQNTLEELKSKSDKKYSFDSYSSNEDIKSLNPDFLISLGGDGTILSAITIIKDLPIPVLGINLGRLGFLASTEKSMIDEAITMLQKGMYTIEERKLLHLDSNIPIFNDAPFALNDFTLHKRDTSSMITIHTYINGDFLNSYWADGIIVATPTGSTGYSLSCGGPIIFPNSGNFVITPVAPHNLNVRPIVISDNAVISFEIEGRSRNFLCTMDSRYEKITSKHEIAIRKCDFNTRLVRLNNTSFLKTIHNKLTWGEDARN